MKTKKLIAALIASTIISVYPIQATSLDKIISTDEIGETYNIAQEEGLKQLMQLAKTGNKEDGWYYIPETKEWIDHGENTDHYSYDAHFEVLLNKKVKSVITYHIHPSVDDFERTLRGYMPPSCEDFSSYLWEVKYLEGHKIGISEARVVDLGGYWSIDLKKSNLAQFGNEDMKQLFEEEYYKYLSEHEKNLEGLYNTNKNSPTFKPLEQLMINTFEENMKSLGIHLKYHYVN